MSFMDAREHGSKPGSGGAASSQNEVCFSCTQLPALQTSKQHQAGLIISATLLAPTSTGTGCSIEFAHSKEVSRAVGCVSSTSDENWDTDRGCRHDASYAAGNRQARAPAEAGPGDH